MVDPRKPLARRRLPTFAACVLMAASISSRIRRRSFAKVTSFDTDFTGACCWMGESSRPQARIYMTRPFFPEQALKGAPGPSHTSARAFPPMAFQAPLAAAPMPLMLRTGSGSRNMRSVPG